jgi:hypothetical protein
MMFFTIVKICVLINVLSLKKNIKEIDYFIFIIKNSLLDGFNHGLIASLNS